MLFLCTLNLKAVAAKSRDFWCCHNSLSGIFGFPVSTYWLETYCQKMAVLYVAIDRTQWGYINLFMISLIWDKRAIPLYWVLLPKRGASDLSEQKTVISPVLPRLKGYKHCGTRVPLSSAQ